MTWPSLHPVPPPCEVSFQVSLLRLLDRNSLATRQIAELDQLLEPAASVSVQV